GRPVWARTLWRRGPGNGRGSFKDTLETVAGAWKDRRNDLAKTADSLTEYLRRSAAAEPIDAPVDEDLVKQAIESLTYPFDWQWGGWGTAPKFPSSPALEFLMRRDVPRLPARALGALAAGGVDGLRGGGVHRRFLATLR